MSYFNVTFNDSMTPLARKNNFMDSTTFMDSVVQCMVSCYVEWFLTHNFCPYHRNSVSNIAVG